MTTLRSLSTRDKNFEQDLDALLHVPEEDDDRVRQAVADIIKRVKTEGDGALLDLTKQFDRINVNSVAELEVSKERMLKAVSALPGLVLDALEASIARVRRYHEEQRKALGGGQNWEYEDEEGNRLGQFVRGMSKVGIYTPGGKASYPSSVIMTAVPARVAEVGELILMVPAPDDELSDVLLAAAHLCGVDRLFKIGGAQAVAALAHGTGTIPRVDKIVGPGNIYVATAKEMVFGRVGIDMIAGPSEVVVVADESARPDWVVMDLFAQAEHDEMARAILISTEKSVLSDVAARIEERLAGMQRADIISQSIAGQGAMIHVRDLDEAAAIVNRIAPEHLEIAIAEPESLLGRIEHAGAIFVGNHSAEVVGDYSAGPSHVLPTGGSARFASPLGVTDFQVRSSVIRCSPRGSVNLSRDAAILAREEGLEAHALSAECRVHG